MGTSIRAWLAAVMSAAALAACGARSDVQDPPATSGGGGSGGAPATTGTTGPTGTTSPSSGGAAPDCASLVAEEEIVIAPGPGLATSPQLAQLPGSNDVLLSFLDAPAGDGGALFAARVEAFGAWPPAFDEPALLHPAVARYKVGPGPAGPVALLHPPGAQPALATSIYPQLESLDVPLTPHDDVLFVAAIQDRYFFGERSETGAYDVLALGSHQPGSLPQSEGPLVCLSPPLIARGVPSGPGFLAAYLEPDPPEPGCVPAAPLSGTIVSVSRYEAPPGLGAHLERTQGQRFVNSEPAVHLALAPASFGAWVVFQTDGSTSRSAPPVVAARLDAGGKAMSPGEPTPVSPGGVIMPDVAVASLGDTLAVAWIDAIDPSAPVIVLQLVRPDGTLGAATSIPTNAAWYTGALQLLPSAAGDALLLAWETFEQDGQVALARIRCLNTP